MNINALRKQFAWLEPAAAIVFFALFAAMLQGCATRKASAVTLFQDSHTDYVIVLSEDASPMEKEAVEDMRELLRQSSGGADFRIVSRQEANACRHRIFIGDTQESRNYLKFKKLENEERVYATVGEDIVIVGGGPCGTAYAVYQYQDVYGYGPSGIATFVND